MTERFISCLSADFRPPKFELRIPLGAHRISLRLENLIGETNTIPPSEVSWVDLG